MGRRVITQSFQDEAIERYERAVAQGYTRRNNPSRLRLSAIQAVANEWAGEIDKASQTVKLMVSVALDNAGVDLTGRGRVEAAPSQPQQKKSSPFRVAEDPPPNETLEEMFARLEQRSDYAVSKEVAISCRDVELDIEGPYGIAFVGDPHIGSPGTDFRQLRRDVSTIQNCQGMIAVALGDYRDNWVGRLSGLYASHDVTMSDELRLVEWFFGAVPWLGLVAGNHDRWHTQGGDPLAYIHRIVGGPGKYGDAQLRFRLKPPKGGSLTMNLRHRFPGKSQYSAGHGQVREALMGSRDDILAAGDLHSVDYRVIWHESEKRLCHGLQVGAYKVIDEYAKENGFRPQNWTPAMAAIVDPESADDPRRHIQVFFDLGQAAEYLTWLRRVRSF